MGYDEQRIPKVLEPIRDTGPRITAVTDPSEVQVGEVAADFETRDRSLDQIETKRPFVPHPGWSGHIERRPV